MYAQKYPFIPFCHHPPCRHPPCRHPPLSSPFHPMLFDFNKELRNPFNPILGETFKCHYEHTDSTTHYIAEQISHHPPSTAFCVINESKGMYLNAYIRPSFRFKGNSLDTTRK
jgi:Oxysterol-binding protein